MKTRRFSPVGAAFSLVEVTLALGLAAFALLSILGLLGVGVNSNRAAIDQTAASSLLSAVIADLRATRLPTAAEAAGSKPIDSTQFKISIPMNPVNVASTQDLYFSNEGVFLAPINPPASAYYRVTLVWPVSGGTNTKTATWANVTVAWPALSAKPAGTLKTFVALDRN